MIIFALEIYRARPIYLERLNVIEIYLPYLYLNSLICWLEYKWN